MVNTATAKPSAYQIALNYLACREHSVFELTQKLAQKGYAAAVIHQTIEQLQSQHYLSDTRFAAMLIRSKIASGQGPVKIRYILTQHHIDLTIIETAFAQCEVNWLELAQQVYEKRFGSKPIENFTEQQKRQRFLYQRGFDMAVIHQVVR